MQNIKVFVPSLRDVSFSVETQKTGAEEVNGLKSVNPKLLHDLPPVSYLSSNILL